jgi:VWFA-related protein
MRRTPWLLALALLLPSLALAAPQEPQDPQPSDVEERVEVDLIIVDTVVLDSDGRTVGNLTKDDFLLSVQGQAQPIDTFDVICPVPGSPEPTDVEPGQKRQPFPDPSERRMVLAFDYVNTSFANRAEALRAARQIVARDMAPGDGIMIVALTDRLRIEQRFSGSPKMALETLQRMEHDVSLYARDFSTITPRGFLNDLGVLADVLSQYPGPKAVVLFSEWLDRSDDWDSFFLETAQRAAAARAAFYPVWPGGLGVGGPTGGSPSLGRLATESGGRFTRNTSDLSMGYVLARRDLSCRYALGFYADADVSRKARTVTVRLADRSYRIQAPERIRLWSEQERQESMLRAAFADPGPNEDPLVRILAYPFHPVSRKSWETALVVNFPLHVGQQGTRRHVGASLDRGTVNVKTGDRLIEFPPKPDGKPGVRPVTLVGVRKVKPGPHTLTVAIATPGTEKIQTARLEFSVPEVPEGELIVRGPILARVDPDAIRMRLEGGEIVENPQLDELIGGAGAVPLLVAQTAPEDDLIAAWEICVVKTGAPSGAMVERRIVSDGEVVHRLDPIPLALEGKKKQACQSGMDKLPGGTLGAGRYRFEVAVVAGDGSDLALGLSPFAVSGE